MLRMIAYLLMLGALAPDPGSTQITLKAMSDPMPKRSGGILGFLKNVMGFLEITSL